jgi:hypothetical protein
MNSAIAELVQNLEVAEPQKANSLQVLAFAGQG